MQLFDVKVSISVKYLSQHNTKLNKDDNSSVH